GLDKTPQSVARGGPSAAHGKRSVFFRSVWITAYFNRMGRESVLKFCRILYQLRQKIIHELLLMQSTRCYFGSFFACPSICTNKRTRKKELIVLGSTWVISIMVGLIILLLFVGAPVKPLRFIANSTVKLGIGILRSEEHTSELQSRFDLVCRLLLEKKNI